MIILFTILNTIGYIFTNRVVYPVVYVSFCRVYVLLCFWKFGERKCSQSGILEMVGRVTVNATNCFRIIIVIMMGPYVIPRTYGDFV